MKNWKTTFCGLALAGISAVQAYDGHDVKGYVFAALFAAFGFLAKDFNISHTQQ